MKKTIKQWIETLPEELSKDIKLGSPFSEVDRLSMAIACGFTWVNSKEGTEFWDSFHDTLVWAEGRVENEK